MTLCTLLPYPSLYPTPRKVFTNIAKKITKYSAGTKKGSQNRPESDKIEVFFSVDLRTLFFYRFSWIWERFGYQNEVKNDRISRKSASGEQSGNFPKIIVLYWFLQYIHEVRMNEICEKNGEIPTFCAEKRRPEKHGGNFTGFSDF